MSAPRVGLIGCGNLSQTVHLNVLARLPGAAVVAFADPDPGRLAQTRCQLPGAVPCTNHHRLLALPGVEAVVICVPPALQAAAAVAALGAGKHVYMEKSVATIAQRAVPRRPPSP